MHHAICEIGIQLHDQQFKEEEKNKKTRQGIDSKNGLEQQTKKSASPAASKSLSCARWCQRQIQNIVAKKPSPSINIKSKL